MRGRIVPEMAPVAMGITSARVVLYSIDLSHGEACDLVVDTGATLSWVPEEVAQRAGIHPTEVRTFRLADGREVDRPVGEAIIECEGLRGATRIVFVRPGDGSVLGLHALEGLGLEVDPVARVLRRTKAFLAFAFGIDLDAVSHPSVSRRGNPRRAGRGAQHSKEN